MNLSQVNVQNQTDDKNEFNELYQLLLSLSKKKFTSTESKHIESAKIDENKSEDNMLKDIFKTKKYNCKGCDKAFIAESLLKDHLEKSKSCYKWLLLSSDEQEIILQKPIHLFIDDCLSKSITSELSSSSTSTNKFECKFCNSSFVNKGNLHKHFTTSIACNRLSYHDFKKYVSSI
jgi:hypothetical protein